MLAERLAPKDIPHPEDTGNIENNIDVEKAVKLIVAGEVVAVEFPGTGGLIYDASNPLAVRKAMEIKAGFHRKNDPAPHTEIQKTTSLLLSLEDLAPIVDMETLSPEDQNFFYKGLRRAHQTFPRDAEYESGHSQRAQQKNIQTEMKHLKNFRLGLNERKFRDTVAGLIFLKLAVYPGAYVNGVPIPEWSYSKSEVELKSGEHKGERREEYFIHVLNFDYDPSIKKLVQGLHEADVPAQEGVRTKGIRMIGVTSMNYSGVPEVVETEKEKAFAAENNLYFLENADARNPGLVGSYTIVNPNEEIIERHGNIFPTIVQRGIFRKLFGSRGREANYPAVELPESVVKKIFNRVPATQKVAVLNAYKNLHDSGLDDMTIEEELIRMYIPTKDGGNV